MIKAAEAKRLADERQESRRAVVEVHCAIRKAAEKGYYKVRCNIASRYEDIVRRELDEAGFFVYNLSTISMPAKQTLLEITWRHDENS